MEVQSPQALPSFDLRHYVATLWRRKYWIIGSMVVCGGFAMGGALRAENRYSASAEILVSEPPGVDLTYVDQTLSDSAERRILNELALIESRDVRQAVAEAIGRPVSIDAANRGDSDVIVVTAAGADPEAVAADVNDYTDAYVEIRTQASRDELAAARVRVLDELRAVQGERRRLIAPLSAIDAQIVTLPPGPERDALVQQRLSITDRINASEGELTRRIGLFQDLLAEIEGVSELTTGGLDVITAAVVPSEPYYPQPKKDLLVGLSVGLLLGLAIAFVRDLIDDAIGDEDDLERALPADPVLGIIPNIDGLADTRPAILADAAEGGLAAEAYRTLAASVEFARLGKPVTVIHITSPVAGEGKSTTAANLAVAFAETGTRVVVIDADLRRPSLHALFGGDNARGLSAFLSRKVELDEALQDAPDVPNLKLLSPGPLPPNPTRLLYARRTEELFDQLRTQFDVVIIDSPPVLPVADTLILTQFADLVLLVVRSRRTGRRILRRARKSLGRVEVGTLATVLNGVDRTGPDGYDYHYGRYYRTEDGADDETKGRRGRRGRRAGTAKV